MAPEVLGAALRFWLLLLVIEPTRDRMVRIVNLDDQIGDAELELVSGSVGGTGPPRPPGCSPLSSAVS
jgi:hypothetical protein